MSPSSWQPLSEYGVLRLRGPDGQRFLQGQLTVDVASLAPQTGLLAAHLNPQGRVISLFYLLKDEDCFYFCMPQTLLPIAKAALAKYAPFYKAELTIQSPTVIVSLEKKVPAAIAGFAYQAFTISPPNATLYFLAEPAPSLTATPSILWLQTLLTARIPIIYPLSSSLFLPHELRLPELNVISFTKGCFTGQEIVARMQYKGKSKKQLAVMTVRSDQPPQPGQDIYAAPDLTHAIGKVVYSLPSSASHYQALSVIEHTLPTNQGLTLTLKH